MYAVILANESERTAAAAPIQQGHQQALCAVDMVQVQTYREIGRHIVEFEQDGQARAAYGKRLLPTLAQTLSAEFDKGFAPSKLRHMRGFYLAFPIRDALRRELSWTHYQALLRGESGAGNPPGISAGAS